MKKKDLYDGQILKSDKFNITVRVVEIDAYDEYVPVRVEYVDGNTNVRADDNDIFELDSFTYKKMQWLYAEPHEPDVNYITLADLEPVEPVEPVKSLRVRDVKVGDILVHPESGMRLCVKEVSDASTTSLPVKLRVISTAKNDKIYHAGGCWILTDEGDTYWFYSSREIAEQDDINWTYSSREEAEKNGLSMSDLLITLEDLVLEYPSSEVRGPQELHETSKSSVISSASGSVGGSKLPSIEELRKISDENDFQKLLELAYAIMVERARDGERCAYISMTFKRCIPHFTREGYDVMDHGAYIEVRW